ncbi:ribosomal protein S12 methylthiotransferase accessory factor [Amycolatopsis xylanica]|uniref:Ribosomal protein S12 methylthiotransferase accessory factor n=1 Tax=Amycolatopsis xylanica TaxID=589385 RepID=A0A1H3PK37_9PSEU|nr:TOMM precursor leader peptide-binding protein [Amycolatopsis xylanica]SDZ01504.1 ribosomal protein S12 methylthiotransferase accessory factor [Amycolatopsis xylanica]
MRRPRLRADYQAVRLTGEDGAYLVVAGETREFVIEDAVAAELSGLLDGTRPLSELIRLTAESHPIDHVARALGRLGRLGVLADGPAGVDERRAAAWDAREIAPDAAESWHATGAVTVADLGADGGLAERLRAIGVPALDGDAVSAPLGSLVVVSAARYTDPRLAAVNDHCLETGREWLLVRPVGNVLLLGPHFVPGKTACWDCLRRRWHDNEQVGNFLRDAAPGNPAATTAALPSTATALAGLLAAELPVIAAAGWSPRLSGRFTALDTRDLTTTSHELIRLPHCQACGSGGVIGNPVRVDLTSRAADAGARTESAESTCRRLTRHVSRYVGAVTALEPLGDQDGPVFTFGAGHNFAVATNPVLLKRNLRGLSGGKGRTEAQAKASALGEAIERYSGVWRDDRQVLRSAYADLAPGSAVPLRELLLFSDRQYDRRAELNPGLGRFHQIPRRCPDDQRIDWSAAWSLTGGETRYLPSVYCWYGHPDSATGISAADSNGCAAGNVLEEAILQGFCELAERDSVALWWYHSASRPGVDLRSFDDPWIELLFRDFRDRLGRELWALDLTADLGIPAFAAVSRRTDGPERVLLGFGAHLDPRVALTRALTEVSQFLPMAERIARGGGSEDEETARWLNTVEVADQPWLLPDPDRPFVTAESRSSLASGDLADDVRLCVRRAADAGLEVLVLDQSRPEIDLKVAKVVAPGLRHFWRRLGPGRLWDVPAAPVPDESQCNPLSVFF